MDPNATLARWALALADNEAQEAREAGEDLTLWLARGGFEPDWTPEEKAQFLAWSHEEVVL
jgi:hypothetical protein